VLEEILAAALARGIVVDAVVTRSERERAALWKMRDSIPEAQRRAGAGLKHDISLPVATLADFVARAAPWLAAHVPDGQLVAYGHVGDGNLHFNLTQRAGCDSQAFLARGEQVRRAVHDLVREFGGSFSAEHGIGRLKVAELERYAPPIELELMRAVKRALDPYGIMNPGKVLRESVRNSE
jgi:D-lactate dehydrogenase (cytochrome)